MEYQSLLHKKLHEGGFVFTAETTPPDASNKEVLLLRNYAIVLPLCLGLQALVCFHVQSAVLTGLPIASMVGLASIFIYTTFVQRPILID